MGMSSDHAPLPGPEVRPVHPDPARTGPLVVPRYDDRDRIAGAGRMARLPPGRRTAADDGPRRQEQGHASAVETVVDRRLGQCVDAVDDAPVAALPELSPGDQAFGDRMAAHEDAVESAEPRCHRRSIAAHGRCPDAVVHSIALSGGNGRRPRRPLPPESPCGRGLRGGSGVEEGADGGEEGAVGGDPVQVVQLVGPHPAQLRVLVRHRLARRRAAPTTRAASTCPAARRPPRRPARTSPRNACGTIADAQLLARSRAPARTGPTPPARPCRRGTPSSRRTGRPSAARRAPGRRRRSPRRPPGRRRAHAGAAAAA